MHIDESELASPTDFAARRILPATLKAAVAIAGIAALSGAAPPARAAVPPFAEEWALPASPQDVDPFGRVWVSCLDDSIRVFTPTGGTLLFAFGGTGSGEGQFTNPYGIAFDSGAMRTSAITLESEWRSSRATGCISSSGPSRATEPITWPSTAREMCM